MGDYLLSLDPMKVYVRRYDSLIVNLEVEPSWIAPYKHVLDTSERKKTRLFD
jgi:hypothetical protein